MLIKALEAHSACAHSNAYANTDANTSANTDTVADVDADADVNTDEPACAWSSVHANYFAFLDR